MDNQRNLTAIKHLLNHIIIFLLFTSFLQSHPLEDWIRKDTHNHEKIVITNDSIRLHGTFSKLFSEKQHPVVVFIWGNGPHTRDQMISGTPMFQVISDSLVARGYATLRIDKRGFGMSTGFSDDSETMTTTLDLVSDIRACLDYLNSREDVDPSRIGLLGHSEGALIGSILASENEDIQFLLLLAPPAVNGREIFLSQQIRNMELLGMDKNMIPKVSNQFEKLTEFIRDDFSDDSVFYRLGTDFLRAHGLEKEKISHQFIDQVIGGFRNPWHQVFFRLNPGDFLSKIQIPVLAIFGGSDKQVTIGENVAPLSGHLQKALNTNYTIQILGNHDHFFLHYDGQSLDKHKPGEMVVSDALISAILNWLHRVNM